MTIRYKMKMGIRGKSLSDEANNFLRSRSQGMDVV